MARRRQIYEGKAKILYEGPEPGTLIQYFKDDATAFNAQKKGTISGKGVLNNRISEHVFTLLGLIGLHDRLAAERARLPGEQAARAAEADSERATLASLPPPEEGAGLAALVREIRDAGEPVARAEAAAEAARRRRAEKSPPCEGHAGDAFLLWCRIRMRRR